MDEAAAELGFWDWRTYNPNSPAKAGHVTGKRPVGVPIVRVSRRRGKATQIKRPVPAPAPAAAAALKNEPEAEDGKEAKVEAAAPRPALAAGRSSLRAASGSGAPLKAEPAAAGVGAGPSQAPQDLTMFERLFGSDNDEDAPLVAAPQPRIAAPMAVAPAAAPHELTMFERIFGSDNEDSPVVSAAPPRRAAFMAEAAATQAAPLPSYMVPAAEVAPTAVPAAAASSGAEGGAAPVPRLSLRERARLLLQKDT